MVKCSISGYADTPQQKNWRFKFKCTNKRQAIQFINRAKQKNWNIKAAWVEFREHGIRINQERIA